MALQVGLSEVNAANAMLNGFRNVSFQIATTWVKLHTGIPGAAGTLSAGTGDANRKQVSFSAASGGAIAKAAGSVVWTNAGNVNETISHCSVWDAETVGNFLWAFELTASKTWTTTGDTLTLTACGLSLTPLALSA